MILFWWWGESFLGRFVLFLFILNALAIDAAKANLGESIPAEKLKITTYNLKWFGIGGTMWNDPSQEFRQQTLRQFFKQELHDSDVIVFTEIVKPLVLKEVLKDLMECVTYDSKWDRHQHVVLCHNSKEYRIEKYDNDYIIDEVNLGSGGQRPAIQAKICALEGSCFLQVIGVHLAAGGKSDKRIDQVKIISDTIAKQKNSLPTVILGDFNTYSKESLDQKEDEIDVFEKIFSTKNRVFRAITKGINTYGTGDSAENFDHIVISEEIAATPAVAYHACAKEVDLTKTFVPYSSYRKYYSDHCFLSTELIIEGTY